VRIPRGFRCVRAVISFFLSLPLVSRRDALTSRHHVLQWFCLLLPQPDDKFSKERITCKKRFNILPTQQAPKVY